MSWDVVLFNSNQKINSVADLDEKDLVPIDFCDALEKHFEQILKEENIEKLEESIFQLTTIKTKRM